MARTHHPYGYYARHRHQEKPYFMRPQLPDDTKVQLKELGLPEAPDFIFAKTKEDLEASHMTGRSVKIKLFPNGFLKYASF